MKFLVTRTSAIYGDCTPPCEGAVLLNPDRESWEPPLYGIELDTLEDLMAFKESVKYPVIINKPFDKSDYADVELEIYDDYRE